MTWGRGVSKSTLKPYDSAWSWFSVFKVAMWVESEPLLEVLVVDWLQLARGGIHFLMCGANCDWLIWKSLLWCGRGIRMEGWVEGWIGKWEIKNLQPELFRDGWMTWRAEAELGDVWRYLEVMEWIEEDAFVSHKEPPTHHGTGHFYC